MESWKTWKCSYFFFFFFFFLLNIQTTLTKLPRIPRIPTEEKGGRSNFQLVGWLVGNITQHPLASYSLFYYIVYPQARYQMWFLIIALNKNTHNWDIVGVRDTEKSAIESKETAIEAILDKDEEFKDYSRVRILGPIAEVK